MGDSRRLVDALRRRNEWWEERFAKENVRKAYRGSLTPTPYRVSRCALGEVKAS